MRDLRLYYFDHGTLKKQGHGKTGGNRHFFQEYQPLATRVANLYDKFPRRKVQYVAVEYTGNYQAKIIIVFNPPKDEK